jgi:hypothetical protein
VRMVANRGDVIEERSLYCGAGTHSPSKVLVLSVVTEALCVLGCDIV